MPVSKVTTSLYGLFDTHTDEDVDRWAEVLHEAASTSIRSVQRSPELGYKTVDIVYRPFAEQSDSIKERYRMTVRRLIELGYWNTAPK